MKLLTRLFFCTFIVALCSCEPEELPVESVNIQKTEPVKIFGDTGGNEEDVIDDKKT